MNCSVNLRKVYGQENILYILKCCSEDFYDQSYNNMDKLNDLANKYAKYANVIEANKDNCLLGFASYYCNDLENKKAFLSMIIVRNQYQRMHVGSTLIKYIISDCLEKGMNFLSLEVDKTNKRAIDFYKRKGFYVSQCISDKSYIMQLELKDINLMNLEC